MGTISKSKIKKYAFKNQYYIITKIETVMNMKYSVRVCKVLTYLNLSKQNSTKQCMNCNKLTIKR